MPDQGGPQKQKDEPSILVQGYLGFNKCELRGSGDSYGAFAPGPHGQVQQYPLGGHEAELLEGTETVVNGGESGVKDEGNVAGRWHSV